MRLRFSEFTFDSGRREVFRGPHPVHLTPKAFQLLELLLNRRQEAVAKQEIQEALWPDVVVTEASLTTLVKSLRKALGEGSDDASVVRTVFGFGYSVDASIVEVPSPRDVAHRHALVWGRQELLATEGANLVGRGPEAPIWVAHKSVSREHARVHVAGEIAELEDLASKNGTFRGAQRVTGRTRLWNGDEVRVGDVRLVYFGPSAEVDVETSTSN